MEGEREGKRETSYEEGRLESSMKGEMEGKERGTLGRRGWGRVGREQERGIKWRGRGREGWRRVRKGGEREKETGFFDQSSFLFLQVRLSLQLISRLLCIFLHLIKEKKKKRSLEISIKGQTERFHIHR